MKVVSIILKTIVVVAVAVGVSIQLKKYQGKPKLNIFRYFTDQTNLFIFLLAGISLVNGFVTGVYHQDTNVVLYVLKFLSISAITVTHVTFHYILRPEILKENERLGRVNYNPSSLEDILVHYVAPLCAVADFLLCENHALIAWWMPFLGICYPLIYFVVTILLAKYPFVGTDGKVTKYPYYFINPEIMGWTGKGSANTNYGVVHVAVVFSLIIVGLGFVYFGLAHLSAFLLGLL